jgi:hypothetical protein
MKIMKKYVSLLIIIVLMIITYNIRGNLANTYNKQDKQILDTKFISTLNTGDLILYRWDWWGNSKFNIVHTMLHDWIPALLSKVFIYHVGIVIKIGEIPYVYQLDSSLHYDELDGVTKGNVPSLSDLKSSIELYEGSIYISKYTGAPSDLNDVELINMMDKYKSTKISHSIIKQFNALVGCKHFSPGSSKYTCSQLIYSIQKDLGINKSSENSHCVTPCKIYKNSKLSNNYSDIIPIFSPWHHYKN